jgi:hypothetical protein
LVSWQIATVAIWRFFAIGDLIVVLNTERRAIPRSPTHQVTNLPNPPIRGWLLLLCLLLIVWQPISVGLTASRALASLTIRGLPLALVLVVRLLVTAVGLSAGLALLGRRTGAVGFATGALIAAAATDLFVYLTPYYPTNRAPGETTLFVAASLAYHVMWIAYLYRSRRVRATFGEG